MRLLLASCVLALLLATCSAQDNNPFLKLLGLGGNGNNGGWNPLSLLGSMSGGGAEKKDGGENPAKHFASIAQGVNGLFKDMLKGAAKFGQEPEAAAANTQAPTTAKDPLVAGLGMLLSGLIRPKNTPEEQKTR